MGDIQPGHVDRAADLARLRHWSANSAVRGRRAEPSCEETIQTLNALVRLYPLAQRDASPLAELDALTGTERDPHGRVECVAVRREWCAVARSSSLMRSIARVRPVERGSLNEPLIRYLSLMANACRDEVLRGDEIRSVILGHHGRAKSDVENARRSSRSTVKTVKSLMRYMEVSQSADQRDMAALVGLLSVIEQQEAFASGKRSFEAPNLPASRSLGEGVDKGYGRSGLRSLLGSLGAGRKNTWRAQFLSEFRAYGFVPGSLATKDFDDPGHTPFDGYDGRSVRRSMRERASVRQFKVVTERIATDLQRAKDADAALLRGKEVKYADDAFHSDIQAALAARSNRPSQVVSRWLRRLSLRG